MADVMIIIGVVAFFALCDLTARACARI